MSDWSEGAYHDLSFSVEKCRRYHALMQAHYDRCYNLIRVATALTGTSGFFSLVAGGTETAKVLTGIVAAAATFDQVFRFNRKARSHEALARRFTDLSSKIAGWEPTPANLKKARAERIRIERDEPPVKRLIDLLAQNEEVRARGISDEYCVPLSKWQRRFGYVWTFGMLRLERWETEQRKFKSTTSQEPAASTDA
ncbi:hypothetical protein [Bradyrhizobium sp. CIR3A]|uniref:hypothetical protein n=1 Tax=Bradyrhizobium sp. CIR3A TaxID=2663838 RepID=UPI00160659A1|nr:hypothetical protein [Bradyrhizobium sp. CIR3A]MBB4259962.1 hypothetical protein [Bradyrhizobium sp. CIR3A]